MIDTNSEVFKAGVAAFRANAAHDTTLHDSLKAFLIEYEAARSSESGMTRDEILARVGLGGLAIVRGTIDRICDDSSVLAPFLMMIGGCRYRPFLDEVISIEPPPETLEQENARLRARIAELEAL
jgi:hypothetical protein